VIVCHCRAVSDRTIRASIRDGASSLDEVAAETGASACCGGCEPTVNQILDEELGAAWIVRAAPAAESSPQLTSFRPLRVLRGPRAA
jgi:bacterioferritin-associated ferredoxin